jgi:antitoxin component YwqK of YwqJK toxin-antitoxin module
VRALAVFALLVPASCLTQRLEQEPEPEEGKLEVVREQDGAGHLTRERMMSVAKGRKPVAQGQDTGWYASGVKRYEREFDHGEPHGLWRTWHENGVLASEVSFDEGESAMRFWYENGVLSAEGPSRKGSRQGVWRCYRPDGTLREEGTYVNSLREGDWTEYRSNELKVHVVYEHGNVKSRQ